MRETARALATREARVSLRTFGLRYPPASQFTRRAPALRILHCSVARGRRLPFAGELVGRNHARGCTLRWPAALAAHANVSLFLRDPRAPSSYDSFEACAETLWCPWVPRTSPAARRGCSSRVPRARMTSPGGLVVGPGAVRLLRSHRSHFGFARPPSPTRLRSRASTPSPLVTPLLSELSASSSDIVPGLCGRGYRRVRLLRSLFSRVGFAPHRPTPEGLGPSGSQFSLLVFLRKPRASNSRLTLESRPTRHTFLAAAPTSRRSSPIGAADSMFHVKHRIAPRSSPEYAGSMSSLPRRRLRPDEDGRAPISSMSQSVLHDQRSARASTFVRCSEQRT